MTEGRKIGNKQRELSEQQQRRFGSVHWDGGDVVTLEGTDFCVSSTSDGILAEEQIQDGEATQIAMPLFVRGEGRGSSHPA